jgi:hypothetical protein
VPKRIAYVCTHKDHATTGLNYRVFLLPGDPEPRCPEHGAMKVQPNKPYHPYHPESADRYAKARSRSEGDE